MKAAIYARKSNSDDDKSLDAKSITRQVDHARAYAERQGWTVVEVFTDDGISGAEYVRRPGLLSLLDAAAAKPRKFDILVVSELSRIGRDMFANNAVIGELVSRGIRLFYYLSDMEERADSPEAKIMLTLRSFASEMERSRCAERTRDALERRALAGHSAGGACFGYDNVPVMGTSASGEPIRTHTDLRINETEAAVVRGIFQMYADGFGLPTIAKTLNGDPKHADKARRYLRGPAPRAPQSGTGSWAPSSVRAMLHRKRYVGIIEYGVTKKTAVGGSTGKRVKGERPSTVERPDLRIIDANLWDKVQERQRSTTASYLRRTNGQLWGRPDTGRDSKYLLSGLARCGTCGANIVVVGGQRRGHHRHWYYACSYRISRGPTVCSNDVRGPMAELDERVLLAIEAATNAEATEQVARRAVEELERLLAEQPNVVPQLEAEEKRLRKELRNLLDLAATGSAPASILAEISRREARLGEIAAEVQRYAAASPSLEIARIQDSLVSVLRQVDAVDLLRGNVTLTRQVLRKVLRNAKGEFSPLVFTPVERDGKRTFDFTGEVLAGAVFKSVVKNGHAEDGSCNILNQITIPLVA